MNNTLKIRHLQISLCTKFHRNFDQIYPKICILSKFFVLTVFITKYDKNISTSVFGPIWKKKILQNVTNRECFTNFKFIITNCDKKFVTKCEKYVTKICCEMWKVLQSVTRCSYKVWQVLKSVAVVTKWDVTPLSSILNWFQVHFKVL